MLGRSRPLLTLLCVFFAVFPFDAQAGNQLSLGLGYAKSQCEVTNAAGSSLCFAGVRAEVLDSFLFKDESSPSTGDGAVIGGGTHSYGSGMYFGGGNSSPAAVLIFVVTILLLYGLIWGVVGLFSHRIKLGAYYSHDSQQDSWFGRVNGQLSGYQVDRIGLQTGFYLFQNFDLQLHIGVGPAAARFFASDSTGSDSKSLTGISTKTGIGYVPFNGQGPMLVYEYEGTFFNSTSLANYVTQTATKIPTVQRTGAIMTGYTFAF